MWAIHCKIYWSEIYGKKHLQIFSHKGKSSKRYDVLLGAFFEGNVPTPQKVLLNCPACGWDTFWRESFSCDSAGASVSDACAWITIYQNGTSISLFFMIVRTIGMGFSSHRCPLDPPPLQFQQPYNFWPAKSQIIEEYCMWTVAHIVHIGWIQMWMGN